MRRIAVLIVAIVMLTGTSVFAYNLPAVNLGFTSFLDGGPPAGPGFYFTEYGQYYRASKFADNNGNETVPPLKAAKLSALVSLNQLIYQSNQKVLFGGKWGLDLILPVASVDINPDVLPDNDWGIGDLLIGPYLQWDPIMGKNGPVFMHRIELQCITPTGKYDNKYALNPGSNAFSFDPYWAATWFILPQWTASWRIHYLWNDENTDPFIGSGANTIQAGQAMHLNFASEYEVLPKHLRLGVNGYYLKQITATEANGHPIGDREQVLGIGPGGVWHISQNDHIFANFYFEMAAENRTEGVRMNLRYVHHF